MYWAVHSPMPGRACSPRDVFVEVVRLLEENRIRRDGRRKTLDRPDPRARNADRPEIRGGELARRREQRDDAVAGRGGQPVAAPLTILPAIVRAPATEICCPTMARIASSNGSHASGTEPALRRDERCQQRVLDQVLPDRADGRHRGRNPATEPCLDGGEIGRRRCRTGRRASLGSRPPPRWSRRPRRSRLSVGRCRDRRSRRRGSPAPREMPRSAPVERRRRPESDRRARQGSRLSRESIHVSRAPPTAVSGRPGRPCGRSG